MKQIKKNTDTKKENGLHVRVKKSLDKYADRVLFPEKLAKANKLLKE
ncbi:MAG: hypothetical protein WDO19_16035 [Bacteroidota bacterium]